MNGSCSGDSSRKTMPPINLVTDYDQYDIQKFEGDDKVLLPEDFIAIAKKKPDSKIYVKPDPFNTMFPIVFMAISLFLSLFSWFGYIQTPLGISKHSFFTNGQYWQSLSAIFMHADMGHFLSNGWLLFIFGWFLKDFGTTLSFPILSLVVGVITNIITVATMPTYTYLIGASGMVYGMVSMWIVFYLYYSNSSIKDRIMGSVAFLLIVMFPDTFQENVSYMAHFVGFVLGAVFGIGYVILDKWVGLKKNPSSI